MRANPNGTPFEVNVQRELSAESSWPPERRPSKRSCASKEERSSKNKLTEKQDYEKERLGSTPERIRPAKIGDSKRSRRRRDSVVLGTRTTMAGFSLTSCTATINPPYLIIIGINVNTTQTIAWFNKNDRVGYRCIAEGDVVCPQVMQPSIRWSLNRWMEAPPSHLQTQRNVLREPTFLDEDKRMKHKVKMSSKSLGKKTPISNRKELWVFGLQLQGRKGKERRKVAQFDVLKVDTMKDNRTDGACFICSPQL